MHASLQFASVGCNRTPGSLASIASSPTSDALGQCDSYQNNIVAHGAANLVCVLDPTCTQVDALLSGHNTTVTCLCLGRFPKQDKIAESETAHQLGADHQNIIISASTDGQIITWRKKSLAVVGDGSDSRPPPNNKFWARLDTLQAHKDSITALACVWIPSLSMLIMASTSTDSSFKLWAHLITSSHFSPWIPIASHYFSDGLLPEAIAVSCFYNQEATHLIIAVGGTTKHIHLFALHIEQTLTHDTSTPRELIPLPTLSTHTDWIRSLSFSSLLSRKQDDSCLYLASASNDKNVRLWKFTRHVYSSTLVATAKSSLNIDDLFVPQNYFYNISTIQFQIASESLLSEHNLMVTGVRWHSRKPLLTTSSADSSVAVWSLKDDGKCSLLARFGLLGNVGTYALGFFGCCFIGENVGVLGHGFGGAIHCWRSSSTNSSKFVAIPCTNGPSLGVSDVQWDPQGRFLIAVSRDKTARCYTDTHVFYDKSDGKNQDASSTQHTHLSKTHLYLKETWRPQVHGHEIHALAFLTSDGYRYVSGSEEKILRVFEAPLPFLKQIDPMNEEVLSKGEAFHALSATVPALGLSNKPMIDNSSFDEASKVMEDPFGDNDTKISSFGASKSELENIPLEEELMKGLLWPELSKLYGHGNEINCLASLKDKLIASATKAHHVSDAEVIIWDYSTLDEIDRLKGPDLTVTQMEFSPNGLALVVVSRDRNFYLYTREGINSINKFTLRNKTTAHTRIINCVAWSHDNSLFVTGSRDKSIRFFHGLTENAGEAISEAKSSPRFSSGVTALAMGPTLRESTYLVVGCECGSIELVSFGQRQLGDNFSVTRILTFPFDLCHGDRVQRLTFRNRDGEVSKEGQESLYLASASEDCSIRVFQLTIS